MKQMNIFKTLTVYAAKWAVKDTRPFDAEEVDMVEKALVVPSQYGNSVQFTLKSGGLTFIPLSSDSTLTVGCEIDLTKAKIVTLTKPGENDIIRILA